ncbi:MAG: Mrp/NBP35 family ATP-binding protein [Chloroflexi bacterium]|nr:Mrp/NBP35 family ATP-binding protein [Chloroflexota bacterium]
MVWRRLAGKGDGRSGGDGKGNGMVLTVEAVRDTLRTIRDPHLGRDLISLRTFGGAVIDDGSVTVHLTLPLHGYPSQVDLEQRITDALVDAGATSVAFEVRVDVPAWQGSGQQAAIGGVKNIIAVASNKGGVGKSTIATNLAVALAQTGAAVGLVDADATGPNLPTMFGLPSGYQAESERGLHPVERYGVRVISLGFLIPPGAPVVWRGPMIGSAIKQLLHDVDWGEIDYLLIDLPPGTSDASMSMAQEAPIAGAVIVSTPQQVALEDASKAVTMFEKLDVPVFGIVENMSYFITPDTGQRVEIFGHGGARDAADDLEIDFLGEVPLATEVRAGGDDGQPIVAFGAEHPSAQAFAAIANRVAIKAAASALLQAPTVPVL